MESLIRQYAGHLRNERNMSPHTLRNYLSDLAQFNDFLRQRELAVDSAGAVDAGKVDIHVVRAYLASLAADRKKSSIGRKLAALKGFFRYLVTTKRLEKDPLLLINSPKQEKPLPKFLTVDDAFHLLDAGKLETGLDLRDRAVGLSGKDGGLILAKKMNVTVASANGESPEIIDIGMVGEIIGINPLVIESLDQNKFIPVIAPVGVGKKGETYNINADLVAGEIAEALHAEKFLLMTDVEGVKDKKGSLMSTLTEKQARKMIQDGVVGSGMIPKVECCVNALKGGVEKTHIIDGRVKHAVLLEIFTKQGIGTEVVRK